MTVRARRRRALVLLSLALACGGLAASQVRGRIQAVERQVGPLVRVVVAKRDLKADAQLGPGDAGRLLAVREVPERFVPRDSFASPDEVAGLRTAVAIPAGAYVTVGQLQGEGRPEGGTRGTLGRGDRAVEIAVAGTDALSASAEPGARVDVLVSTEPRSGPGRTFVALEDVELLGLRPGDAGAGGGDPDEGAAAHAGAIATLRVTLREAVYLAAAQNFAREVRLLSRPAGDRARVGRSSVSASGL